MREEKLWIYESILSTTSVWKQASMSTESIRYKTDKIQKKTCKKSNILSNTHRY